MAETGDIPIGLYGTAFPRIRPDFARTLSFPEYLRVQNIRAEKSATNADARDAVPDAGRTRSHNAGTRALGPHRDATLPRIGDVLPVCPRGCEPAAAAAAPAAATAPRQPASTQSIDGLGRLIDVLG